MARVLVVDDERSSRRTFVLYLRDDGHEIETVATFDEAIELLERSEAEGVLFGIVVTDVLPQRASVDLMKTVSERWPEIEVILATEEQTLESAISAVRGGAHGFISKPVTPTKLRRAVASAASTKSARDKQRLLHRKKEARRDELTRLVAQHDQQVEELCLQLAELGVDRAPASIPEVTIEQPPLEPGKRILVVDDERTLRRVFSMFLSDEGLEVETADNVDDGIAAIEQSYADGAPFALVVTDIIMPGHSGEVLMQRVSERWPEIKIIVVTGEPTVATASLAVQTRAYEYICKPVSSWVIRKVVATGLEARTAEDEKRREAGTVDIEIAALQQHIDARTSELEELRLILAKTPK